MKVFLSWSGPVSQKIATALRDWLPYVAPNVEFWMSSTDVELGSLWLEELAKQLEEANFGIIFLTSDNLDSPWLLFEAGAIAKAFGRSRVIPFLYDVEIRNLPGPLKYFQAARMGKDDIRRLVVELNTALTDRAISEVRLNTAFDTWWPRLEKELEGELTRLMRQHPESVYQFLAERFGVGHGKASFECSLSASGAARVERVIDVEAFSEIASLDTFLLFPEAVAENRQGGLRLARAWSLDSAREIEYRPIEREPHRLSSDVLFTPPLKKGDRTTYGMVETARNPVFRMAGPAGEEGVVLEPEYFGWTVYRPTRELHLKVTFPRQHVPDEFWLEVRRASSYGFPTNPVERKEVDRLEKPRKEKVGRGRYALSMAVEYPVHGFVYLLFWQLNYTP